MPIACSKRKGGRFVIWKVSLISTFANALGQHRPPFQGGGTGSNPVGGAILGVRIIVALCELHGTSRVASKAGNGCATQSWLPRVLTSSPGARRRQVNPQAELTIRTLVASSPVGGRPKIRSPKCRQKAGRLTWHPPDRQRSSTRLR